MNDKEPLVSSASRLTCQTCFKIYSVSYMGSHLKSCEKGSLFLLKKGRRANQARYQKSPGYRLNRKMKSLDDDWIQKQLGPRPPIVYRVPTFDASCVFYTTRRQGKYCSQDFLRDYGMMIRAYSEFVRDGSAGKMFGESCPQARLVLRFVHPDAVAKKKYGLVETKLCEFY